MKYSLLFIFLFFLVVSCSSEENNESKQNFSVSTEGITAVQIGGSEVITISSSRDWSIECSANWVEFSQLKGNGEQSVTLTISPNPDTDERNTTVKITSGNLYASFLISQAGIDGTIIVSPVSAIIDPAGKDLVIKVSAEGIGWESEIPEEVGKWISKTGETKTESTFAIKLNNSKSKRNATLIFRQKGGTISKTVTLSQDPFQSTIADKKWLSLATTQPSEWYSSNEAKEVAENVLLYQKNAGGWPKNVEIHHILTDTEKAVVESEKGSTDASKMACLDNDATTTEMRFLAKMYKYTPDERYKEAFGRGLDFLIEAQYPNTDSPNALPGGWPQFYPLRGGYSDRITFNDNLMTNILRLLIDIYKDQGDFSDIVEKEVADKAKRSYDLGIQCILDCQVVENGSKTFWGAQHDEYTLDPAVGRPHELPSYSGAEGNDILKFLMEIDNPSQGIKDAIISAVIWLESVKIADKKVVDVKVGSTTVDRVVENSPGNDMWGRFIQLKGAVAERVYSKLFDDLKNSKRNVIIDGKTYSYNYAMNAKASYNPDNAYKPIYGIYDSDLSYLLYRFLYIYEDSDNAIDEQHGLSLPILSLNADRRTRYQYLGNWPQNTIRNLYPAWKQKNGL